MIGKFFYETFWHTCTYIMQKPVDLDLLGCFYFSSKYKEN